MNVLSNRLQKKEENTIKQQILSYFSIRLKKFLMDAVSGPAVLGELDTDDIFRLFCFGVRIKLLLLFSVLDSSPSSFSGGST